MRVRYVAQAIEPVHREAESWRDARWKAVRVPDLENAARWLEGLCRVFLASCDSWFVSDPQASRADFRRQYEEAREECDKFAKMAIETIEVIEIAARWLETRHCRHAYLTDEKLRAFRKIRNALEWILDPGASPPNDEEMQAAIDDVERDRVEGGDGSCPPRRFGPGRSSRTSRLSRRTFSIRPGVYTKR